jgi:hypothetical protein
VIVQAEENFMAGLSASKAFELMTGSMLPVMSFLADFLGRFACFQGL